MHSNIYYIKHKPSYHQVSNPFSHFCFFWKSRTYSLQRWVSLFQGPQLGGRRGSPCAFEIPGSQVPPGPVLVLVPTLHPGHLMGILSYHLAQEMTGLCLPLVHYRTKLWRMWLKDSKNLHNEWIVLPKARPPLHSLTHSWSTLLLVHSSVGGELPF